MQRRSITIGIASLVGAWFADAQPAAAERLITSISRHQVLVTSSFTGTSIVLFGTVEPDKPGSRMRDSYDLVVTATGPRQTLVTRRKERMVGIWVNGSSRTFVNVPSYLHVLSNRPFDQIANTDTLRRLQVGLDYFQLTQQIGPDVADTVRDDPFRVNFIRIKTEHRLYGQRTNGVTFLTPTLFRAEIALPAEAPLGSYDADVKLFAGGELIARTNTAFEVVKVGFEQFVATAARDQGILYGIATVMMALLTGWLAGVMFRRD
jgi:uncharacterized protein (TIGR02186 family)